MVCSGFWQFHPFVSACFHLFLLFISMGINSRNKQKQMETSKNKMKETTGNTRTIIKYQKLREMNFTESSRNKLKVDLLIFMVSGSFQWFAVVSGSFWQFLPFVSTCFSLFPLFISIGINSGNKQKQMETSRNKQKKLPETTRNHWKPLKTIINHQKPWTTNRNQLCRK